MTTTQPNPAAASPAAEWHGALGTEIRIVREVIRRVMELSEDDPPSLNEYLKLLEGLSLAATRVASLLKTDRQLSEGADFSDTLNEALEELYAELRREEGNM